MVVGRLLICLALTLALLVPSSACAETTLSGGPVLTGDRVAWMVDRDNTLRVYSRPLAGGAVATVLTLDPPPFKNAERSGISLAGSSTWLAAWLKTERANRDATTEFDTFVAGPPGGPLTAPDASVPAPDELALTVDPACTQDGAAPAGAPAVDGATLMYPEYFAPCRNGRYGKTGVRFAVISGGVRQPPVTLPGLYPADIDIELQVAGHYIAYQLLDTEHRAVLTVVDRTSGRTVLRFSSREGIVGDFALRPDGVVAFDYAVDGLGEANRLVWMAPGDPRRHVFARARGVFNGIALAGDRVLAIDWDECRRSRVLLAGFDRHVSVLATSSHGRGFGTQVAFDGTHAAWATADDCAFKRPQPPRITVHTVR